MILQQNTVVLHENPVKSWLIQALLTCGDEGLSMHDPELQSKIRCLFSDDALELSVLADDLYLQGIVSLRALEWMYLSTPIRELISNCIEDNRQPIW